MPCGIVFDDWEDVGNIILIVPWFETVGEVLTPAIDVCCYRLKFMFESGLVCGSPADVTKPCKVISHSVRPNFVAGLPEEVAGVHYLNIKLTFTLIEETNAETFPDTDPE